MFVAGYVRIHHQGHVVSFPQALRTSVLLIGLLATCSPAAVPRAPQLSDDPNPIVIGTERFGTTVVARVGQILLLPRPADHETWRVSYSPDIVRPLVADEAMRNPGKAGWRFRVIGRGETDLSFEPIPDSSCGETPRIAQQRFVVTIRASD
jgi:hypothetical protein